MKKYNDVQFNTKARAFVSLLLAAVMVLSCCTVSCFAAPKETTKDTAENTTLKVRAPEVRANSYVVMSGSTSEVLLAHHADRKMPIGSITKLMTAMAVIDNMHDASEYDYVVDISGKVDAYGDDFKAGDGVSVEELLKAMIVGGSDEAAEALARYSSSKRKTFIAGMNSKAIELGLERTHFSNPTGLHDHNHYATANECAVIAQTAMRYSKIKEITALDMTTIRISGKNARTETFTNTNPLLASTKTSDQYRYIKGGILSTLEQPQKYSQYAGIALKDDMQYIVVMLEAKEKYVPDGAIELFEYGDAVANKYPIIKADKCVGRVKVRGGARTRVKAYTETKGFAYIPPEGSTDLVQTEVVLTSGLEAPLKAGTKVGEYRIYVADELKGTVDLIIKKDIKEGWLLSKIYISNFATVLTVLIILVGLYMLMRVRAANRRKMRIKKRKRDQKIREMAAKQAALDEDRRRRKWTYSNYDSKDLNDAMKRKK